MISKNKEIVKIINKRLNKINESYENYQNNPYVPDHVHGFRVNMRKLRALLNFLKPIIVQSNYDEVNQTLRDIGKELSPLRDLDTLIEECTELAYEQPDLIDNYTKVFQFLHKERIKLIDQLSKQKVFNGIEDKLLMVKSTIDDMKLKEPNTEDFVSERFDHKVSKLEKQYKKLDKDNYEEVHDVRKQAKKVRYSASGFKKVLPKKEAKKVKKEAKKIQRELGELTDAHVMVVLLEEYKGKTSKDKLETAFTILIDYHEC